MPDKPVRKFKPFTFTGSLTWTGGRTWDFSGETAASIHGAPPKMFNGEDGKLTPEDLMLASVNTCMLSTFTSYAKKANFEMVKYESDIEGLLEHTEERGYIFTKIIVRPKITVKSEAEKETALELLKKAHGDCWMSNSLRAEIIIEPEIMELSDRHEFGFMD